MKKRILSILLISALLLSAAGCKTNNSDAPGVINGGSNQVGGNAGDSGENGAGTNNSGTTDPSGNASDNTDAPGDNTTPGGDNSGEGSTTPGGSNTAPGGNSAGNQDSLKETFAAGSPISVKAGESVWYGPASPAQKEQLTFTNASGKATTVTVNDVVKVDSFINGFVIYSYKAPSDGSVAISVNKTHEKLFLAAKSAMDVNAFYGYWDNQKDRNLYDIGMDKCSKQIDTKGKLISSEESSAMHAIPVKKGETLTIAPVNPATMVLGCGYDAAMKPIEIICGYGLKEAFAFPQGKRAYTYTVPEGIAFIRFNVPNESQDTFLVMKGKEFDLNYYTRTMKVSADALEDPLYRKECLFVGDSLCSASQDVKIDGQRGWARRVKELSGAICTNAGRGGAALSTCRMGSDDGSGFHRIGNQLTRYKKEYDYILIEGGANDAWSSAPIGKPTKGYDPTFFDLTTYAGGLEMAIYTAITEYGDTAAIGYMSTFKMPRNTHGYVATRMHEYYAVGKEICEKWNIAYFDMYNHEEINRKLNPISDEHVPDGTHADESGYDILGPYITDFMRSLTPVTQKIRDELAAIQ